MVCALICVALGLHGAGIDVVPTSPAATSVSAQQARHIATKNFGGFCPSLHVRLDAGWSRIRLSRPRRPLEQPRPTRSPPRPARLARGHPRRHLPQLRAAGTAAPPVHRVDVRLCTHRCAALCSRYGLLTSFARVTFPNAGTSCRPIRSPRGRTGGAGASRRERVPCGRLVPAPRF